VIGLEGSTDILEGGHMDDVQLVEKNITWEEIEAHQHNDFIYRGQNCAYWNLASSLERACLGLYETLDFMPEMEWILLREFRRRFHHYSQHIPDYGERLRWLSLMQHHGAPTRLVDWTYSIYIALYFALEQSTSECCVWKINKEWLTTEGRTLFKSDSRETLIFDDLYRDENRERDFAEAVLKKDPIAAVIQVGPFQLDERLSIQKGVFLYPCDPTQPFRANLESMPGANDPSNVVKLKIILNKRNRLSALRKLHDMNINRATLFPGLDGFAQSLNVYHPSLSLKDG
jgi:hypothetical protein